MENVHLGAVKKSKRKLLPIHRYFRINLKSFLLETSLNGLKYVDDPERNIWERYYYLLSFSTCFTAGLYMAYYFLQKWQTTPVIISLSSETTSIQNIPFPSITFCNMNQALRSKVGNFSVDSPDYAMLMKLCFQEFDYSPFTNFKPRYEGDNIPKFITRNAQTCEDMIVYCKFGPTEERCTDLFREVLLDEGLCCVFNQLHPYFLFRGESYYLISFSACFSAGLYMALYFLEKWQNTPVLISLSSETTSIQDIPFPSVTFCNMNQALRSKVANYSHDSAEYAMLNRVCFQDYDYSPFRNFKPRYENDTLANFIVRNTQSCEDMIIYCKFGPTEEKCTDLFREILLDEGLCCVFNQMHPYFLFKGEYKFIRDLTSSNGRTTIPVKWDFETGYPKPLPKIFYPRTAPGSGVTMGFTVILKADINDYYCSSTNGPGFKMLLYNPIDTPHIKDSGLPITLGCQTRVRINAKRTEAMSSLRRTTPWDRQCYFSDEHPLQYYKYYTRRNCEMECDAQLLLRMCNCIPYYMPMIQPNASICFLSDLSCVAVAEALIVDKITVKCKEQCLSGCNELTFFPDLFLAPLSDRDYKLQDAFFQNMSRDHMRKDLAQVNFYYRENFFRGNTKVPYTGFTDFMSQTGGIMSLMVGFSVISVAEFFFFSLMKPFFDMILRRPPEKLDVKDDIDVNVVVEQDKTLDKFHHQMLFKRRKPIHNRKMVWKKDVLQQHYVK